VSAIVSPEELAATTAAVEEFRAGAGPRAHAALKADDEKHKNTSYIAEMWYDMYLRNRDPFPLNLTPQLTWKQHDTAAKNDQATRAADICHAAARYYASLKANNLMPDAFHMKPHLSKNPLVEFGISSLPSSVSYYAAYAAGAYPLDMSQYSRLFCSTRVPRAEKDELVTAEHSSYVAAFRGGHVYKIHLFKQGSGSLELLPPQAIEAQLRSVLASTPSGLDPSVPRIGALSGMERSSWAATRAHMETDPANKAALQEIDSALFVLSLDPDSPETHEEQSRAMLHGVHHDRWFDKSFNIAVCANGRAGISWEHAWGDGVAVLNFFNEVHDAISAMPNRAAASDADLPSGAEPEQLRFNYDSKAKDAIAEAVKYTDTVTAECDLNVRHQRSC
jgi:carnitine O-palmitoyltransferase 2